MQNISKGHKGLFLTSYPKLQKNENTCSHSHLEIDQCDSATIKQIWNDSTSDLKLCLSFDDT